MARCFGSLAVFLCVLLMLACCQALSSNVDDGYGHEDGSFESDSLIKLNNDDDVLTLKSSDRPTTESSTVSVSNFGAKGDGKTDDTQAFKKAWKKACSTNGVTTFLIPKGKTYLLKSIRFRGPCKSLRSFQILGTLSASTKRSDYSNDKNHWLILEDVNNLSIDGGSAGIVDGNGNIWWQNSCKIDKSKPCTKAPTALTLYNLKNLNVKNLRVRNAQQIQISIEKCNNVGVKNVKITAPGDSPNTDGIHIVATKNIRISNSDIGTGDDCISIEDGSQNVQINDLTCGPGHGISIGSLGDDNSKAYVSGIDVDGATLSETDNGVRIKTYQGGSGTAKNIKFQNIRMDNVKNPIIIDQNYCDKDKCEQQESAVQVNNVVYQNIKAAVGLLCSSTISVVAGGGGRGAAATVGTPASMQLRHVLSTQPSMSWSRLSDKWRPPQSRAKMPAKTDKMVMTAKITTSVSIERWSELWHGWSREGGSMYMVLGVVVVPSWSSSLAVTPNMRKSLESESLSGVLVGAKVTRNKCNVWLN